jgi:hypothetical protein
MRSAAWISLLRQLPQRYHEKLVLVSAAGQEIMMSSIFRIEDEYLILRGRMAGSTDAGTFVFIPFDQISYIGFREEIKEAEMAEVFGAPREPVALAPTAQAPLPEQPPPPEPAPAAPAAPAAPPTPAAAPAPVPGKAALLERLRRGKPQG